MTCPLYLRIDASFYVSVPLNLGQKVELRNECLIVGGDVLDSVESRKIPRLSTHLCNGHPRDHQAQLQRIETSLMVTGLPRNEQAHPTSTC